MTAERGRTASSSSADARALLATRCARCHGPDRQRGHLRLDSVAAALAGGQSGPAVVAGNPEQSLLVARVRLPLDDPDHMPPADQPQLTAGEVATLRAWIEGLGDEAGTRASARGAATGVAASGPTSTLDPASTESRPDPASPSDRSGVAPPPAAPVAPAAPVPLFATVESVLLDRCGKCHRGERALAGVHVDDLEALRAPGKWATLVVPGSLEASLLWARVARPIDDEDHMPPVGEPQLTPGELELLRRWIEHGAARETTVDAGTLSPEALAAVAAPRAAPPAESAPTPDAARQARVERRRLGACALGLEPAAPSGGGALLLLAAALGVARGRRRRSTEP